MKRTRKGQSCKEDSLNPGELVNLIDVCHSLRSKFIVYSLVFGGLRVGELVHLKRTWINWEENTITVPLRQKCNCKECLEYREGMWKPKTRKGARTFRIDPRLRPVMENYLNASDGLSVTRQRVWQIIKELSEIARILHNTYPHCLRATCATILAYESMSSPGLQHVMGWARLSSAESYVKSEEKRAIKEQDEIYEKYSTKV